MSSSIKRICNEVIEANEKAPYGEYTRVCTYHADRLARALLVMEEALEKIKEIGVSETDCMLLHPPQYCGSVHNHYSEENRTALKALTQAEKILGGGG